MRCPVEHWIVSNRLVIINTPTDPPTFYSRVWKTTSTPDIAIATDNIQKIAKREVSEQPGGSDHKPVILTLAKQVNASVGKMPPQLELQEGRLEALQGTHWHLHQVQAQCQQECLQL